MSLVGLVSGEVTVVCLSSRPGVTLTNIVKIQHWFMTRYWSRESGVLPLCLPRGAGGGCAGLGGHSLRGGVHRGAPAHADEHEDGPEHGDPGWSRAPGPGHHRRPGPHLTQQRGLLSGSFSLRCLTSWSEVADRKVESGKFGRII